MITAAPSPGTEAPALTCEWERVELLGSCLESSRRGRLVGDETIESLRTLHARVTALRSGTRAWANLPVAGLSVLEMDVLACALAPDAQPRLAWLMQELQPGISQPFPTLALAQALLAVEGRDVEALRRALLPGSPLRVRGLVEIDGEGPFQVLKPGRGVLARLLGVRVLETPPGAEHVRQHARWDDLVLAAPRKEMLREFLLWVRHRETVVRDWLGDNPGGPIALFTGASGTGKTFAAVAIADDLGWPLFRVDLGKLVSKYIGETEKNLNRLFDAAHDQPMVLQFDEVDSIMGKRGEIREARDRYANMEVSHLLSRVERHRGPCILTTNLRGHLDQAFYRRFQIVVEFPFPDAPARAALWHRLLPPKAPRDDDVTPGFLGPAVGLTGGNIRNAALHAAYLAADAGRPISRSHLAVAVWRELTKCGKPAARHDLGPLAASLPAGFELTG